MTGFLAVFSRELRIAWSGGAGAALPVGFFLAAAVLAPFAIGSERALLTLIGPGLVWVLLVLSSLISLDRMVQSDLEDGALDHLVLGSLPLEATALAKVSAHWLTSGLSLVIVYPIIAIMLAIPLANAPAAMLALTLGSFALFLWGGVAAALAAGVRRGGPLIAVLVLPLYSPIVIFGSLATKPGIGIGSPDFLFLTANCLVALAIAPFAMASAMRLGVD